MDEIATSQWFKVTTKLAKDWAKSMTHKSAVKLDEGDILDFLVDLWLVKGGQGHEFEEQNRGQLYSYVRKSITRSRDVLLHAGSMSDACPAGRGHDDVMDEDRLEFLSYSDDEDTEAGADYLDPAEKIAQDLACDELGDRIEELDAILDASLSGALADVFGTSDRRGRSFSAEARSDKIKSLIFAAGKSRDMQPAEVKKLATEISAKHRRSIDRIKAAGGDVSYDEIEAFEQTMGLRKSHAQTKSVNDTATAIQAKIRSRRAKRQPKSVLPVPQQRSKQQSIQLELV